VLVACIGSAIGLCFIDMKTAHKAAVDRAKLWTTAKHLNLQREKSSAAVLKETKLKRARDPEPADLL
jgi:hypothetical protein